MDRYEPVLGMKVQVPDDLAQPLDVALIVKGLDSDGRVAYWTISSENLQNVEILGMMHWGADVALRGDDGE